MRSVRRRIRGDERGQTFAEVMVAILLTAIITTSVMSVGLTSKRAGSRSDHKMVAAMAARRLQQYLGNYVAMNDPSVGGARGSGGEWAGLGPGPGGAWNLPGDVTPWALAETGGSVAGCPAGGPLGAPFRDATATFVPTVYQAAPVSMTLRYRVVDTGFTENDAQYNPRVMICAHWTEIQ